MAETKLTGQLVDTKSLNTIYNKLLKQIEISNSKTAFPTFSDENIYSGLINSTATFKDVPRYIFIENNTDGNNTDKPTLTNGTVSAFAFELKNIFKGEDEDKNDYYYLSDMLAIQSFVAEEGKTQNDTQIYSNGTVSVYPGILSKYLIEPTKTPDSSNWAKDLIDNDNWLQLQLSNETVTIKKKQLTLADDPENSKNHISTLTVEGCDIYKGPYEDNKETKLDLLKEGYWSQAALYVKGGISATNGIIATKVFNAVWNDIADCISVDCKLESGYCYKFDGEHYSKTTKYADKGFIGIHSDTAGFYVGQKGGNELYAAVGGFVLAHVDKEYPVGTPLTCTCDGKVTKMKKLDMLFRPHRIIGTYWKLEKEETWGPEGQKIFVKGRHWIKIK